MYFYGRDFSTSRLSLSLSLSLSVCVGVGVCVCVCLPRCLYLISAECIYVPVFSAFRARS